MSAKKPKPTPSELAEMVRTAKLVACSLAEFWDAMTSYENRTGNAICHENDLFQTLASDFSCNPRLEEVSDKRVADALREYLRFEEAIA